MCFAEKDIRVTFNLHAFTGECENGKSASLIAVLLGLGYDVGLSNYSPDSLCGCELKGLTFVLNAFILA
jgi:hypothetical protein